MTIKDVIDNLVKNNVVLEGMEGTAEMELKKALVRRARRIGCILATVIEHEALG